MKNIFFVYKNTKLQYFIFHFIIVKEIDENTIGCGSRQADQKVS